MTQTTQLAEITNPILSGSAGQNAEAARSGSLIFDIVGGILQFMMVVGALYVLLNLVIGGMEWIGSTGDSTKVAKARDRIKDSIFGLIILSATFAIWILVKDFLGVEVTFQPLFPA